ncbi:MAG TPA: DUF11 domain-containing protein [Bacteroidota bacterium]|nr:DUF11 domain-containing protein [Bacteroidota bacterium]
MMRLMMVLGAAVIISAAYLHAQTGGRLVVGDESSKYFARTEDGGNPAAGNAVLFAGETGGHSFGLVVKGHGRELLSSPVIEIRGVEGKKVVRRITLAEYFGRTDAGWKKADDGSSRGEGLVKDRFAFSEGGVNYIFGRTIASAPDASAPGGKRLTVAFSLTADKETSVQMRLLSSVSGYLAVEGSGCRIGDGTAEKDSKAFLLLFLREGKITAGPVPGAGEVRHVTFESETTGLVPGHPADMIAFTLAGTTVGSGEYALQQAENYFAVQSSGAASPQMVAVTSVDKPSTAAGDTVTYTIVYCNIGTAPAAGVSIDNPIPAGTHYLENSAFGDGGEVVVNRADDSVRSLGWKFALPIVPGERKAVQFRVKVL